MSGSRRLLLHLESWDGGLRFLFQVFSVDLEKVDDAPHITVYAFEILWELRYANWDVLYYFAAPLRLGECGQFVLIQPSLHVQCI